MPNGPKGLSWAPRAERDIREIWLHYAVEASPAAANRIVLAIRLAAARIGEHPLAGRSRDGLRPGLRSVLANPYVVFYRFRDDAVQVSRVVHGSRDLDAALSKRD